MKIYDERVSREFETGPQACDLFYLRVRCFRFTDYDVEVHIIVQDWEDWVGEPPRIPRHRRKIQAVYGKGDSQVIRKAIAIIDEFKST